MKLLLPIFSLSVSTLAIILTPWPTAREMFSPRSIEWILDVPAERVTTFTNTIAKTDEFR